MNRPMQTMLGSILIQEEACRRRGQLTLAILAEDSERYARECAGVFEECGTTARTIEERNHYLIKKIELYAADGIFDTAERDELIRQEEADIRDAQRIQELAMGGAA